MANLDITPADVAAAAAATRARLIARYPAIDFSEGNVVSDLAIEAIAFRNSQSGPWAESAIGHRRKNHAEVQCCPSNTNRYLTPVKRSFVSLLEMMNYLSDSTTSPCNPARPSLPRRMISPLTSTSNKPSSGW